MDDPRGWARVINEVLDRIDCGDLKPGGGVPSRSDLSADLDVSRGAVSKALGWLTAQRIVRREAGYVYIVTSTARERAAALIAARSSPGDAGPAPGNPVASGNKAAVRLDRIPRQAGLGWVRVANLVLDRVIAGQHAGLLPSLAELGAENGVSRQTAAVALKALAARGVVYQLAGHGYYVSPLAARAAGAPRREVGRDDLVLAWGQDWAIDCLDGTWRAIRHDGRGEPLTARTPEDLNALIRAEQEGEAAL